MTRPDRFRPSRRHLDALDLMAWAAQASWAFVANGFMSTGWSWVSTTEAPPWVPVPRPVRWRRRARQGLTAIEHYLAAARPER